MAQDNTTTTTSSSSGEPLFYTDKVGNRSGGRGGNNSRGGSSRGGGFRGGRGGSRGGYANHNNNNNNNNNSSDMNNSNNNNNNNENKNGFNNSRGGRGRGGSGSGGRGGMRDGAGSRGGRGGNFNNNRGGRGGASQRNSNGDKFNNNKYNKKSDDNNNNENDNNNNDNVQENQQEQKKDKTSSHIYYQKNFNTSQQKFEENRKLKKQQEEAKSKILSRNYITNPPNYNDYEDIHNYAAYLYDKTLQVYLKDFQKNAKRDDQMNEKMQFQGTTADRVAAVTLLVQSAPMFRLESLDILLDLVEKKSDRDIELSMVALKDLFVSTLLPDNKLKRLRDRMPITKEKTTDDQLSQWYFEDMLKLRYGKFINCLEHIVRGNSVVMRTKALDIIYELLSKKPELEEIIMTLLINKLGDLVPKVGALVAKHLRSLLYLHPGMRLIVIREVDSLMNRPNVSNLTQLNCMRVLSEMVVFSKDKDLINKLIEIYLTFLKTITEQGKFNSQIIPTLLRGMNSVVSVTHEPLTQFDDKILTLFKIVHTAPLHTSIMTLSMLFEMKKINENITDRFYNALYSILNRTEIVAQMDQTSMINLLYKSLKNDRLIPRVKAIIKKVLQFSFYQRPSFAAAALLLVSVIFQIEKSLYKMVSENNEKESPVVPDQENEGDNEKKKKDIKDTSYDPFARVPQFANADESCFWELIAFTHHYHPSVQVFANTIISGEPIIFKGNPSITFTLPAFLEKFVIVNPSTKLYTPGQLQIRSSTIAKTYGSSLPDEQFLNQFFKLDETVRPHGDKTGKRKGWIVDDDELDAALYGATEEDAELGDDDSDDIDDSDLDAEYSYEDLADSDFEEDTANYDGSHDLAVPRKGKKATSTGDSKKILDEIAEDEELMAYDSDEEEEEEEGDDVVEDEVADDDDEFEEIDEDDVEAPDFGEDDDDEFQEIDEDDVEVPDFGEDGDDDDDDDDDEDDDEDIEIPQEILNKYAKKSGKKTKISDDFADADDFAQLLEDNNSNNSAGNKKLKFQNSRMINGGGAGRPSSKKNNTKFNNKNALSSKRKR